VCDIVLPHLMLPHALSPPPAPAQRQAAARWRACCPPAQPPEGVLGLSDHDIAMVYNPARKTSTVQCSSRCCRHVVQAAPSARRGFFAEIIVLTPVSGNIRAQRSYAVWDWIRARVGLARARLRTCQPRFSRSAAASCAVSCPGSSSSSDTSAAWPGCTWMRSTPISVCEWPWCWKYSGGLPARARRARCSQLRLLPVVTAPPAPRCWGAAHAPTQHVWLGTGLCYHAF